MKKQKLKETGSYYYEERPWYDDCPDTLPKTPDFKTEILPRAMKHKEILDTYKIVPYASYAEAASVVASIIPELKWPSRIAYFKEKGILFRFNAWRDGGGQLYVRVRKVDLSNGFGAGDGVCFSNSYSESLPESLGSLDSSMLMLSRAIEICKENNLKVYKEL